MHLQHATLTACCLQKVAIKTSLNNSKFVINHEMEYIIIYKDGIGHIFAKHIIKGLILLKVMIGQKVIQCTLESSIKREVSFD